MWIYIRINDKHIYKIPISNCYQSITSKVHRKIPLTIKKSAQTVNRSSISDGLASIFCLEDEPIPRQYVTIPLKHTFNYSWNCRRTSRLTCPKIMFHSETTLQVQPRSENHWNWLRESSTFRLRFFRKRNFKSFRQNKIYFPLYDLMEYFW